MLLLDVFNDMSDTSEWIRRTPEDWNFDVPKLCAQNQSPKFERVWTSFPATQNNEYHEAKC